MTNQKHLSDLLQVSKFVIMTAISDEQHHRKTYPLRHLSVYIRILLFANKFQRTNDISLGKRILKRACARRFRLKQAESEMERESMDAMGKITGHRRVSSPA